MRRVPFFVRVSLQQRRVQTVHELVSIRRLVVQLRDSLLQVETVAVQHQDQRRSDALQELSSDLSMFG